METTLDDVFTPKILSTYIFFLDTNKLYSYYNFKVKADFHHFQLAEALQ